MEKVIVTRSELYEMVWSEAPTRIAKKYNIRYTVFKEKCKQYKRNNPNYWGKGFSWLSIADMNQGYELIKTKEEITKSAISECKMQLVPQGTLLMSFKLSVGKVGFAGKDIYTNEAIASLPVKNEKEVNKNYLFHALKSLKFDGAGDRAVKGITLNKAKLNNLNIPLPPLPEQKRIATILDKADALRQKNKQQLAAYDELLQAVFWKCLGIPFRIIKSGLKRN